MTKREAKRIQAILKKHMDSIAKERDKLDDSIAELETLRYECEAAYDCLYAARDALSELV